MNICIDKKLPFTQGLSEAVGFKNKFWENGQEIIYTIIGDYTEKQKSMIQKGFEEWSKYANLKFIYVPDFRKKTHIRVDFKKGIGSWSYIGTDCLSISQKKATMNIDYPNQGTIYHEIGHALGLGHEHQNPEGGVKWNTEAVFDDMSQPPNSWNMEKIKWNILETYDEDKTIGTEVDKDSIMMYPIPKKWTLDGFSAKNSEVLSEKDKAFIQSVYPFPEEENKNDWMDDVYLLKARIFAKIFTSERQIRKNYTGVIRRMASEIGLDIRRNGKHKPKYILVKEFFKKINNATTSK